MVARPTDYSSLYCSSRSAIPVTRECRSLLVVDSSEIRITEVQPVALRAITLVSFGHLRSEM